MTFLQILKFNKNHEPAGSSEGGQFASSAGSGKGKGPKGSAGKATGVKKPRTLHKKRRNYDALNAPKMHDALLKEANSIFSAEYGAWKASLPRAVKDHLLDYAFDGYKTVNAGLRGKGKPPNPRLVQAIDKALDDAPRASADFYVYRGIKANAVKGLKVGKVFTDKGYMSTSLLPEVALGFTSSTQIVMRIKVPEGAKGAFLGIHPQEAEFLLPRNTALKITKDSMTSFEYRNVRVIEAEVVYLPEENVQKSGKAMEEKEKEVTAQKFVWDEGDLEEVTPNAS